MKPTMIYRCTKCQQEVVVDLDVAGERREGRAQVVTVQVRSAKHGEPCGGDLVPVRQAAADDAPSVRKSVIKG